MRDVREWLKQAAEPDAQLDLSAVRARADQLRRRRRATAVATSTLVIGLVVGAGALLLPGDDRSVVLPPAVSPEPLPRPTQASVPTQRVHVFFSTDPNEDCSRVSAFPREVAQTQTVAAAALRELLRGPTEEEVQQGAGSFFGPSTVDLLLSVRVVDRVAYVDLRSFDDLSNVSTACGSTSFLAELDATVQQFPTVDRARYAVEGDPQRFYASLERVCPPDITNADGSCDDSGFEQPSTGGSLPSQAPALHGGTPVAVYLAVSTDPLDPAFDRARAEAAAAGYEVGGGELGCDQGAVEALGLDQAESWSHVALYFADQATADRFVRGYPHEVVGVAQVTTYCLD